MLSLLWYLLLGLIALVLLGAVVAPLESLGWWAGWYGQKADDDLRKASDAWQAAQPADADHWLVYLSGIGILTGERQLTTEAPFICALQEHLPRTVVSKDVFPYSVTNLGLNSERLVGWFWERAAQAREQNPFAWEAWFVALRNLLQVAVSADNRYGPIYNLGVAKEILKSLLRHGYLLGSGKPVTIYGYSGGGQIALGVAPYLKSVLKAPLRVISMGGVMSSDPGLDKLDALVHIDGAKDKVDDLGHYLFPGRWPLAVGSPWNRALAAGKIQTRVIGPFTHTGPASYLDAETFLPDGRAYMTVTLSEALAVLEEWGVDTPLPVEQQRAAKDGEQLRR